MTTLHEDLARFVRAHRRTNRLTQEQLAQLAGVGRRFVSDLENAKPTVRMAQVDAVLHVFGKRLGIEDARSPESPRAGEREGC